MGRSSSAKSYARSYPRSRSYAVRSPRATEPQTLPSISPTNAWLWSITGYWFGTLIHRHDSLAMAANLRSSPRSPFDVETHRKDCDVWVDGLRKCSNIAECEEMIKKLKDCQTKATIASKV